MADHRREQILDAIEGLVTDLATTGSNVWRGLDFVLPDTYLPGLVIFQGDDEPADDDGGSGMTLVDSWLTVRLKACAKDTSEETAEETLNRIFLEVTQALAADYTLGLDFVIDSEEGPTTEPDRDSEGERPVRAAALTWRVKYRRSRTDPSTG
ncbi:MAG: hypothetical protein ACLFQ3_06645 [Thiohalorhabdus sp.]